MNTWTGTIGHVGKPTLDGRTIVQIRTDLERGVIPLEHREGDPAELTPVGKVLAFSLDAEGTVTAAGLTTLEPGDYIPGMVLTDVENEIKVTGEDGAEVTEWFCSGALASVFVHPPAAGDAPAAWLDAKITVTAAPELMVGTPEHYGVRVTELGDGGYFALLGHHPRRRSIAAVRRYLRLDAGLTEPVDFEDLRRAELDWLYVALTGRDEDPWAWSTNCADGQPVTLVTL